jgi:hypothetical protein
MALMADSQSTCRHFLSESTTLTTAALQGSHLNLQAAELPTFRSQWDKDLDRVWLGSQFWANPLQDWQVHEGRVECLAAKPNRNVHVLTRELADRKGYLHMSVKIGRVGDGALAGNSKGSAWTTIKMAGR